MRLTKKRITGIMFLTAVIILSILAILIFSLVSLFDSLARPVKPRPTPNNAANSFPEALHLELDGRNYSYRYFEAGKNTVGLIPNFSQKLNSKEIMRINGCKDLINGGFYTQNDKPLGLFYTGGKKYGQVKNSRLLDGFISDPLNGFYEITFTQPELSRVSWALQNGPVLIYDGTKTDLAIRDDYEARRSVAAVGKGSLYFLTVFTEISLNSGPLLADLPDVLEAISEKEGWDITSAINLDGGSASAFIMEDFSVPELKFIGSALCVY